MKTYKKRPLHQYRLIHINHWHITISVPFVHWCFGPAQCDTAGIGLLFGEKNPTLWVAPLLYNGSIRTFLSCLSRLPNVSACGSLFLFRLNYFSWLSAKFWCLWVFFDLFCCFWDNVYCRYSMSTLAYDFLESKVWNRLPMDEYCAIYFGTCILVQVHLFYSKAKGTFVQNFYNTFSGISHYWFRKISAYSKWSSPLNTTLTILMCIVLSHVCSPIWNCNLILEAVTNGDGNPEVSAMTALRSVHNMLETRTQTSLLLKVHQFFVFVVCVEHSIREYCFRG